jgi:hypothetical protein
MLAAATENTPTRRTASQLAASRVLLLLKAMYWQPSVPWCCAQEFTIG